MWGDGVRVPRVARHTPCTRVYLFLTRTRPKRVGRDGERVCGRRIDATDDDTMSTHTPTDDGRTDRTTDTPDTYALASELGVDAALLARFVDEHPSPTAPIVLGWAHARAELPRPPEHLRDDVEAWLEARSTRRAPAFDPDELRDSRMRCDTLAELMRGEGE